MKIKADCPNCEYRFRLEEIRVNAQTSTEIYEFNEDGVEDCAEPCVTDSDIGRFQCYNCGYVIEDDGGPVTSYEDLCIELRKRDWLIGD